MKKNIKLFLVLLIIISGCSNQKIKSFESTLQSPIYLYAAKDGQLNIVDYENKQIKQIGLKKNRYNPPQTRREYFEIIEDEVNFYLSGYQNLVIINKESEEIIYHKIGNQQQPSLGIGSRSLTAVNGNFVYLNDLGLNTQLGEVWEFCTETNCILLDDGVYGAGVFTAVEENQNISVLLHEMNLEDGVGTFYGNKIRKKTISLEGEVLDESVIDFGIEIAGFMDYFRVGEKEYFQVEDDNFNYLIQVYGTTQKKITFDKSEWWGPTKDEGRKVIGNHLYLFLGEKVAIVDLELFEIVREISLSEWNESQESNYYSYFTENRLYILGKEHLFIYNLDDFSLVEMGEHGLDGSMGSYAFRIVENQKRIRKSLRMMRYG